MSIACVRSSTRVSTMTLQSVTRAMLTLTLFPRCSRLISVNVSSLLNCFILSN